MTFLEKTKRFFEPIIYAPWIYLRSITECTLDGLYLIASLYFFEKIIKMIQVSDVGQMYQYIKVYAVLMIIYIGIKIFVRHWGWGEIVTSMKSFLIERYLNRYIEAEPNMTERIGTGRFISILSKGEHVWGSTIHTFLSNHFPLILVSIYGVIRIMQINPLFGYGIIGVIIIFLIVSYFLDLYYIVPSRKKRIEAETEYSRGITRVFMSKIEYLQNNRFTQEKKELNTIIDSIVDYNKPMNNGIGGMHVFIRTFNTTLRIIAYIYIGNAIFKGTESIGSLSIYMMILVNIETATRSAHDAFREFTRDFQHIEKLWSTFDSLTPIKGYDTGKDFKKKEEDIIINSISYGYNDTKVFSDFSVTIKKGKKTALVGASGGGKTTLMKLIAGYLHPEPGSISVMGNTLSETALKSYYPHIGYLTQDPSVFDATIRENLISAVTEKGTNDLIVSDSPPEKGESEGVTLKKMQSKKDQKESINTMTPPNLPFSGEGLEQRLIDALKLAQCEFVFEMEKGLDTEIGERGVRLSGGQKQRLAIAKIFLKNPEIILLDEPTSALDSFSEEKITEALDTLFEGRTVIIIAHRLQTVKKADDIIVIEGGQIIERGTHSELIEKRGVYNTMLELQSGF